MKKFFDEDLNLGSLNDPEQIKLLLLYIFISVRRPMTLTEITDTVRYEELCNYFDMTGCLKELVKDGLMDKTDIDGTDYYSPTAKGFSALSQLERHIPKSIRDKADVSAANTLAAIIRKESVVTEIKEVPMGYMVRLSLNDETMKIFDTTLYMPSMGQAKALCRLFKANPEEIYMSFMGYLTEGAKSFEDKED